MECYCFLRNIVDTLANKGKTPFELRYNSSWYGPIIPFGTYVHYLPTAPKDKSRTHQFGNKWLKGLFVGYDDKEGGGWSQRLLVVDWEELDKAEKPEHVYMKPIPHKEVKVIKSEQDKFIYPLKQKMLKQPGSPKYEMTIPQQGIQTSDSAGEVI